MVSAALTLATLGLLVVSAYAADQCKVFLPNPGTESDNSSSLNTTARIVNGRIALSSTNKFLVSFHEVKNDREQSSFCTGSLISPLWVLTAAHCRISKANHIVRLGGFNASNGPVRRITRVKPHERFGFELIGIREILDDDIALVKLDTPAPSSMTPIKLNSAASVPDPGKYARVAGYGVTKFGNTETGIARSVDVPVKSSGRCTMLFLGTLSKGASTGLRIKDEVQFCAGYEDGKCDSCQGDSGGPLFLYDSNKYPVQIGITSFGLGCALKKRPGVYARISAFVPWIREHTENDPLILLSTDGQQVEGDGSEESFLDKLNPICFPATSNVRLRDGSLKRMDQLVVGDEVLSSNGEYSPVFMFTHRLADVDEMFVRLHHRAGFITLSAGHYLFVGDSLKPAADARVGETLTLDDGSSTEIQRIEQVQDRGLYNPQTVSGTIVVDGVKASAYTTTITPLAAHGLLRPLSALFKVFRVDATLGLFDQFSLQNVGF